MKNRNPKRNKRCLLASTRLPTAVPSSPQAYEAEATAFAGIDPNAIYTTREAAPKIGQSEAFLEARRAKGLLPSFLKLGRSVKYVGSDLIAFLKDGYKSGNGAS